VRIGTLAAPTGRNGGHSNEVFGKEGPVMRCLSCGSDYQGEFAAEMIIHFSGMKNLDKAGVWVFPKLLVCLDCGFSRLTVPVTELLCLKDGTRAAKALIPGSFVERRAH
jgi:hypothetical protein